MTGRDPRFEDERWAAAEAGLMENAVPRPRHPYDRQAAERWMCGELFTDDDFEHGPPPPVVRNCIRDLADYRPPVSESN